MASILLFFHVLLYLIHRDMARTFDDDLHELIPGNLGQLAHRMQFGKLGGIVRIINGTRTEPVADRNGDVVHFQYLAYLGEMRIQEILFIVDLHPLGHD